MALFPSQALVIALPRPFIPIRLLFSQIHNTYWHIRLDHRHDVASACWSTRSWIMLIIRCILDYQGLLANLGALVGRIAWTLVHSSLHWVANQFNSIEPLYLTPSKCGTFSLKLLWTPWIFTASSARLTDIYSCRTEVPWAAFEPVFLNVFTFHVCWFFYSISLLFR